MIATKSLDARVDEILKGLGSRATGPRRKVARLLASKRGAFSAESIHEELPGVGRATVYRTIRLLAEAGVLCRALLPDGSPRYSFDHSWHHHHLICSSCETVEAFRSAELERLLCELGDEIPGRVLGHQVDFYVNCPDCLKREGPVEAHTIANYGG